MKYLGSSSPKIEILILILLAGSKEDNQLATNNSSIISYTELKPPSDFIRYVFRFRNFDTAFKNFPRTFLFSQWKERGKKKKGEREDE